MCTALTRISSIFLNILVPGSWSCSAKSLGQLDFYSLPMLEELKLSPLPHFRTGVFFNPKEHLGKKKTCEWTKVNSYLTISNKLHLNHCNWMFWTYIDNPNLYSSLNPSCKIDSLQWQWFVNWTRMSKILLRCYFFAEMCLLFTCQTELMAVVEIAIIRLIQPTLPLNKSYQWVEVGIQEKKNVK